MLHCEILRRVDVAQKLRELNRQSIQWKGHLRTTTPNQVHGQHKLWPAQEPIMVNIR